MKRSGMAVPSTDLFGCLAVKPQDIVLTPDWVASDVVAHFRPAGRVLDPCKGEGAFLRHMPGAEWCEIREGRDFFCWTEPVDWIVSNPPYSCFRAWLRHSYAVAENIVYLVPVQKCVLGYGQVEEIAKGGMIKHIRWYGTGTRLGWMYGNAIGAVHFIRGYDGPQTWSFYTPNSILDRSGTISKEMP